MEKVQEILFENKQKIPEGVYLELMNNLKIAHETKNDLYEIEYIVFEPVLIFDNNCCCNNLNLNIRDRYTGTKIIKLKDIRQHLEEITKVPFKPFSVSGNYGVFNEFLGHNDSTYYKTRIRKTPYENDAYENDNENNDDDCPNGDEEERLIKITLKAHINPVIMITSAKKL